MFRICDSFEGIQLSQEDLQNVLQRLYNFRHEPKTECRKTTLSGGYRNRKEHLTAKLEQLTNNTKTILLLKNVIPTQKILEGIYNDTPGGYHRRLLLEISGVLGQPFSFSEERKGLLVKSLTPESRKSLLGGNWGSNKLNLHTEVAWCEMRPDFVALLCTRTRDDQHVMSYVLDLKCLLSNLSKSIVNTMKKPIFQIGLPESMRPYVSEELYWSRPIPLLTDNKGFEIRVNLDFVNPLSEEARNCLDTLVQVSNYHKHGVELSQGDLLIINNRKALHGRDSFEPYFDNNDRLLKQVYIKKDLQNYDFCVSDKPNVYNALRALPI